MATLSITSPEPPLETHTSSASREFLAIISLAILGLIYFILGAPKAAVGLLVLAVATAR